MPFINKLYFKFRHFFAQHWPRLYSLCDHRKAVLKFIISGSFAGATDLVFLFIFYGLFRWGIVLSTSLAFILSFVVSFSLQKFWTFRNYSQTLALRQFVIYIINAFIGLNLNGWAMHALVNQYQVWYMFSQIIVNLTLAVYNFMIYKFIIFRSSRHADHC